MASVVVPNGTGSLIPFSIEVKSAKGAIVFRSESLQVTQRFPVGLGDDLELDISLDASVKNIRRRVKVSYASQVFVIKEDFSRIHYPPPSARSIKRLIVPREFCELSHRIQWLSVIRANSEVTDRVVAVGNDCKAEVSVLELPGIFVVTLFSDGAPIGIANIRLNTTGKIEEIQLRFARFE